MNDKSDYAKRPEYANLPRPRRVLVDAVMEMMAAVPEWRRGWKACDVPLSLSGREYRGENNVSLSLTAMKRGYDDPRWMTFNQMRKAGWSFRRDEGGNSLGKDSGVPVSFYELRDKKTKAPFSRAAISGLSPEEVRCYMRDNVYPMRKTYVVFNASIIDGVPKFVKPDREKNRGSDDAEDFIDFWSREKTPLQYGGNSAAYVQKKNLIRLPRPESFETPYEFYSTALHEISHSCQAFTRPGVVLSTNMSDAAYRDDELSAELSSVFLCQKLCGAIDTRSLENSAAYLTSWLTGGGDEGKAFFDAVAEADRLCRYATDEWERQKATSEEKAEEYLAGISETKEKKEPEKIDSEADIQARDFEKNTKTLLSYRPENLSDPIPAEAVDARLGLLGTDDRKKMEAEFASGRDPAFKFLYFGGDLFGDWGKNARATMTRCAYVGVDEETTVRLFRASAYWSMELSPEKMKAMTDGALDFVARFREQMAAMGRRSYPHVKPRYTKHTWYGGK